jgi:glyoxylase-like metal-dependent hydrolase (beta-lactamase superfamily II)
MIRIGRFGISRIEEVVMRGDRRLFRDWDEAAVAEMGDWYVPDHYRPEDGSFPTSIHAWLVRAPEATILIDLGCGRLKTRPGMEMFGDLDAPFLERLAAEGVRPQEVTHVIFTHLHIDHVGWATLREGDAWRPTFPNALHVMPRVERERQDPALHRMSESRAAPFRDSVQPILDQAQVALVDGDEREFLPGLDFLPVPGHSPGMMAVRVSDAGGTAIFSADVMHQPIQVRRPDWNSAFCEDKAQAARTRRRFLELAADEGALVLPAHFGGTHCGWVRREDDGFIWVPRDEAP